MDEEAQTTDGGSLALKSFKNTFHNHIIMCLQTVYYGEGMRPSGRISGICLAGPPFPSSRVFSTRSRTRVQNKNRMSSTPEGWGRLKEGYSRSKRIDTEMAYLLLILGLRSSSGCKKCVKELQPWISESPSFHFFFVFSSALNMEEYLRGLTRR